MIQHRERLKNLNLFVFPAPHNICILHPYNQNIEILYSKYLFNNNFFSIIIGNTMFLFLVLSPKFYIPIFHYCWKKIKNQNFFSGEI